MPDGHGIQTGDKIDVFWTGGRRYGMAATVAGDNVTLAGGGGDNLPANGTSVMLCEETAVNAAFDPADLTAILVNVTNRTSVVFVDASGAASSWRSNWTTAVAVSGGPTRESPLR